LKERFPPRPPFRELQLGKDNLFRVYLVCEAHQINAEVFGLSSQKSLEGGPGENLSSERFPPARFFFLPLVLGLGVAGPVDEVVFAFDVIHHGVFRFAVSGQNTDIDPSHL
jgi:hypothetical protein